MIFHMPVKIYEEDNCIWNHRGDLKSFGKKAIIVTGKKSSKLNGSLDDVIKSLSDQGIEYIVFDDIEENPSVETVMKARDMGVAEDCDFVIGLGGGSPLDAAKAVAIMIANKEESADYLYTKVDKTKSLPIIAIPTTCGTGSEVTAVSVLTVHAKRTKCSLPHRVFPDVAFVDAKYIMNAPHSVISSTSVDALSHLIESYVNNIDNDYLEMVVAEGLKYFADCKDVVLGTKEITEDIAKKLMHASTLAGIAIAHGGTTVPHSLSYMITYEMKVVHGVAVGYFLPWYMEQAPERFKNFVFENAGFKDLKDFTDFIEKTCKIDDISDELKEKTIQYVLNSPAKLAMCPFDASEEVIRKSFDTFKCNNIGEQKMKKGILFDLDGTLWDSSKTVVDSWNEALELYTGAPYRCTVEMMHGFMGKTMEEIAYLFFKDETKEDALKLLNICTKYENEYIAKHGGILFEGLEETLAKLQEDGYFLAIVSNCQEGYIEAFLEHHNLYEYFDDTENYGRTGRDKDYNIRLVVERNNLDSAVYVGDIMGDYNSTMKAGLPFIHAAYGFGTVPEGTPKVMDIRDLPEMVKTVI